MKTANHELESTLPSEQTTPPTVSVQPRLKTPLRSQLLPHLAALAAFTVVSVVATWPITPQLGGYVIDKGDPLYSVWGMAWQAHALSTNPLGLFDTNIMYPFKGTLAFDELSFAEAVFSAPLYWITGNPVLSHNAQLLATFILSGYGAWLLVRHLTGSGWAGLIGGSAFAFSFYRLNHLPHMTLISTEWIPFMLFAAYKLLWGRSWRWAGVLGAFFAVEALSGHYLAFYSAMLIGLFVLFYAVASRHLFSWRLVGKLASGMGAAVLLMLPIAVPYVLLQSDFGFRRSVFEAERFSNTLTSFLSVFRGNPLYRALLAPFADPGPWAIERAAFPGLATILLATAGVTLAWRNARASREASPESAEAISSPANLKRHAIFFSIVALVSALLSMGPSLQLTYAPSNYDPNAVQRIIPLPYAFLHDWVPGFQSMRVVTRIGVLTALSLGVLAGIGSFFVLTGISGRISRRSFPSFAPPIAAVLIALLPVFESWSAPIHMEPIGTRSAVPPVYRWLAAQPRTIALEYPMVHYKRGDPSVEMANTYQYYSVYHWQYLLNGSTTVRPYSYSALVHETEDCFPCPRSLDTLWALGVEYVVVHLENLSGPQRTDFLWRTSAPEGKVLDDFVLVKDFGGDRVYKLKPRSVGELAELIPPRASVLLAEPVRDPIRDGDESSYIAGGYLAALGFHLQGRALYGDARLSFGEPIREPLPDFFPDYAILWTNQDPNSAGYLAENRIWANEIVSLYKRGPVKASSRDGNSLSAPLLTRRRPYRILP